MLVVVAEATAARSASRCWWERQWDTVPRASSSFKLAAAVPEDSVMMSRFRGALRQ